MKNKVLLSIFALITFFSFGFIVNAEDLKVTPGQETYITYPKDSVDYKMKKYSSFSCTSSSDNTTVSNHTGDGWGFGVSHNSSSKIFSDGEVKCTYKTESGTKKTITYKIKYEFAGVITISGMQTEELDANGDLNAVFPAFFSDGVKSYKVTAGANYVNVICPNSAVNGHCTVQVADAAYNKGSVTAKIEFTLANGKVFPVEVRINAWGGARAYPGGYVTCKANSSQWKEQFGVFAGNINFWQATTGSEIQLPDCGNGTDRVVTAGTPIVFAGWVDTWDGNDFHNLQVTIQGPGECKNVAGEDHFYAAGKTHTVRGDKKARYTACFEYVPMVRIAPGHGELKASGWTEGVTGIYYKEPSGNADITLPSAGEVSNEAGRMHHELVGWQNEFDRSIIEKPGAKVKADGTVYSAVYDYDSSGSMNNRSVYINDKAEVSSSTKTVKTCSTESNEYLTAKTDKDAMGNTICVVEGLKITPEEVTQPVTVEFDDGSKIIYKFTVVSDFGFYDQEFEPTIMVDYQEPKAENDKSIITDPPCEYFETTDLHSYSEGMHVEGSGWVISSVYGARCKGSGGAFNAGVCLDPGIAGPHGTEYKFEKYIDNFRVYAMVEELAKHTSSVSWHGDGFNPYRMGVNTAFRIAFIANGDTYAGLAQGWFNAGKALREGDVDGALNAIFTSSHGEAYNVAKTYLDLYDNAEEQPDKKDSKFEVKKATKTTLGEDGNSYTVDYTGSKLYVPAAISISTGPYDATFSEFGFSVHVVLNKEGHDAETDRDVYDMTGTTLTVPNIKNLKVPKAKNAENGTVTSSLSEEQKKAAVKLTITSSGALKIYTIVPVTGQRQRLLFFDEQNNDVYLYLDPGDGDHYCNQVDALKVEDCNEAAKNGGGGNCNLELFAMHCCNLVNEGSYPDLYHNYCHNSCSNNTVAQVCEYVPFKDANATGQSATMYEIREGVKYSDGKFEEDLGACVVNTAELVEGNEKAFEKVDDVGNSRVLKAYANNKYCRVTCKEDWDISMGSFGSYMGKDAVSAGTYFEIKEADIFIKGDQSCYTSQMNVDRYYGHQKALAQQMPDHYNKYSDASHALKDMLYEGKTSNAAGNSVNHKNSKTYDNTKSGSVTLCKGYKDVQYYKLVSYSCGTPTAPRTCDRRENVGDPVRECSTNTSALIGTDPTNNEVTLNYISWIQNSMEFKDEDNLVGKYRPYSSSTGASVSANSAKAYDNLKATISCEAVDHGGTGDNSADTVKCSISGGHVSETFDWDDIKASDTDLSTKVNERIVDATTGVDAINDADKHSDVLKEFIKQNKKALQAIMNEHRSAIVELESLLKANASNWYDCQNFVMYTVEHNDTKPKVDDELALAKTAYGISDSFKALGDTRKPIEIPVQFNPSVSYTYDELIYMNLIDNKGAHPYGSSELHDNILVPYNKKNGTLTLGHGEEKDIKLVEEYSNGDGSKGYKLKEGAKVPVNYSVKTGNNYSSVDSKTYSGTSISKNLQHGKSIVLCKVGQKGQTNVQGQTSVYAPFAGEDVNGWNRGNCYTVGLYYYEGDSYTKETISNSSFYKNKGSWSSNVNGVIAHGGDEEGHPDQVKDAIEKYKAVTKIVFPTDNKSLRKWSQLGSINVFPVSMTTARNLYTYTYSFNNIGVYFAKDAMDTTRYARLMGTVDSVFKYNTRTCFYEVKEDICKCCGDPMEYHYTSTRKTDTEIVERFIASNNRNGDLTGATSNADKIKENTSGSMGLFNTVSNLNSLFNNVSNDSGSSRTTPANWSDSGIYMFDGFSRYVTNKGEVAAKAIEYMGEEIYSANNSAEYAYRLTPEAIAQIKDDNSKNSYGTNYDALQVYGAVQMAPVSNTNLEGGSAWNMNATGKADGENVYQNISFQHYGSKFLEDFMSQWVKHTDDNGFTNLDLANRKADGDTTVCAILENNLGDGKNGQTNYDKIHEKIKGSCRWVDYIEKDGYGKSGKAQGAESDGPFRLAFK